MVCVVCWCCDICQPKYILLLLYMQTPLFGAPQMKPQISCNLKLFTHKKWTAWWCGLGLRACLAQQQHNEATHTLRVFCARCRENKGLGLNYSPAAAAEAERFTRCGCCCCCCCLSTVKSNTGGGAPFAPFAPFIACAWCGACGAVCHTTIYKLHAHTHT
jgi:hypothetical protein